MEFEKVTYYKTPIGTARIVGDEEGISSISVIDNDTEGSTHIPTCLQECVKQLDEYFKGTRTTFNLKLNPQGTEFQKQVWRSLQLIPYGKTWSYLQQSEELGDPSAIRAVAHANAKNPIWIIIPCHRVIGSDGSLTGYAGGLWRKRWLLEHENPPSQQSLF
ncbi:MAG: methylated-DNA--[protein]-cysteine S-methyltransferase [Flavobacteriaceae bacterium]|nr:methylated-DNA--[protein]-cysteine S-methyltransferase [Flavobacteriaceae bacterium]MCB0485237.1 methylated-DNA--[protein]-cysteine S-methyltransferase [Flavobacteriaceae bacterium]